MNNNILKISLSRTIYLIQSEKKNFFLIIIIYLREELFTFTYILYKYKFIYILQKKERERERMYLYGGKERER